MERYTIIRRGGWQTGAKLDRGATRSGRGRQLRLSEEQRCLTRS